MRECENSHLLFYRNRHRSLVLSSNGDTQDFRHLAFNKATHYLFVIMLDYAMRPVESVKSLGLLQRYLFQSGSNIAGLSNAVNKDTLHEVDSVCKVVRLHSNSVTKEE